MIIADVSARRGGRGFAPAQLRSVLPKAYIHRMGGLAGGATTRGAERGDARVDAASAAGRRPPLERGEEEPVDAFLRAWDAAHARAAAADRAGRARFADGARRLGDAVPAARTAPRLARRGYVVWRRAPYPGGGGPADEAGAARARARGRAAEARREDRGLRPRRAEDYEDAS